MDATDPLTCVTPTGKRVLAQAGDVVRPDGLVERTCEHGVAHPIGHVRQWTPLHLIHACDGCCRPWRRALAGGK